MFDCFEAHEHIPQISSYNSNYYKVQTRSESTADLSGNNVLFVKTDDNYGTDTISFGKIVDGVFVPCITFEMSADFDVTEIIGKGKAGL